MISNTELFKKQKRGNYMEWLAQRLIHRKKTVTITFLVAAVICMLLSRLVSVNYDMMDYLPEDSSSTIALEIMEGQFEQAPPNVRVMLRGVGIPEALDYKKKLSEVEGVSEINWLDDTVSIQTPLETIPQETVNAWYRDGNALFSITVEEEKRDVAVHGIRDLLPEDAALTGSAVTSSVATETTGAEISTMMLIAVPLIFIILFATTNSWAEPFLFMITIGVAIVLNSGTNLIMGEISFVTQAAGPILQLAVSLDYSIFLLHRFEEYKQQGIPVSDAMVKAVKTSFSSIMSSGLTTVIGFAALIFMRFRIGPDMGIAMAKAIAFSLVSVLLFMPALVMCCYKLIDKTHHKPLIPKFKRFGKFVSKSGVVFLVAFVVAVVPCVLAQNQNSFEYGASNISDEQTKLGRDTLQVEEVFGKSNAMVLMVPKGDIAREKALYGELSSIPQVQSIISYVGTVGETIPMEYVPESSLNQLISEKYSRMVLSVSTDAEGEEAFSVVEQVRAISQNYYPDTYQLAGNSVNTYDMRDVVTADTAVVNGIAIGAIFLILLITFQSILIPVVLVLAIEGAIWINLAIPYFTGDPLFYIAYLILSTIQLGATVDYAILMTHRYIEMRANYPRREALKTTVNATSISILTSACILFSGGTILGGISTNGVISQIGYLVGRGAVISAACVLLVLPVLLCLLDKAIQKTTLKLRLLNS